METLKDIFGLPANATERELRLAAQNARMAEGWVMADDDRARAFVAACPLTPTPHRSPERIGLERGAVGVSPDDPDSMSEGKWMCIGENELAALERGEVSGG